MTTEMLCKNLQDMLDDPLCRGEMTGYQVDAVNEAIAALRGQQKVERKSPCALCGYGGKHLDAPPCTRCPAHPKEAERNEPLTLDERLKMQGLI